MAGVVGVEAAANVDAEAEAFFKWLDETNEDDDITVAKYRGPLCRRNTPCLGRCRPPSQATAPAPSTLSSISPSYGLRG